MAKKSSPVVENVRRDIERVPTLKDNFNGEHKVPIERLQAPPEAMMCRETNQQWVDTIKRRILNRPAPIRSVLPVMIDSDEQKENKTPSGEQNDALAARTQCKK